MLGDSARCEPEQAGGLGVGLSARDPGEYLAFAGGQAEVGTNLLEEQRITDSLDDQSAFAVPVNERSPGTGLEPLDERLVRGELAQEPSRRRGGVLDLAASAQQDHATGLVCFRLIEADAGGRQLAPRPRGLPEPGEVGLEQVEHEPVALPERALGPVEAERLEVGRRRGDVDLDLVLETVVTEHDIAVPSSVQFASRLEVRELEGAEVALRAAQSDRSPQIEDARFLDVVQLVVTRSEDVDQVSPRHTVVLLVEDPVGLDEPPQLDEQLTREGVVAAEALGLADEAEQPLRVTSRECRHGHPKIRRITNGNHRRAGVAWVTDEPARPPSASRPP